MSDEIRTEEPNDRLTRIGEVMTFALESHSEASGMEQAIVMINDGPRCGIVLHGYDSDGEAVAHMIFHLKAIFAANGQNLHIAALGEG